MKTRYTLIVCGAFALLLAGCKQDPAGPKASTQPGGDDPADTIAGPVPKPLPLLVDDHVTAGVWLSANGAAAPEVPQGWPLIVTATVLGAAGPAAEFSADDLAIHVTDSAGKDAAWALNRVSKTAKFSVDETAGARVTWLVEATPPPGSFVLIANLKGAASNSIPIRIVPAPATLTSEQEPITILAGRPIHSLWKGDFQSALKLSEDQSAKFPTDFLPVEFQGDALTGPRQKIRSSIRLQPRLLNLFLLANPKADEPPAHLTAKIRSLLEPTPPN